MAAWAEQGYVIILPNVTGSLGYGVDFANGMALLLGNFFIY